MQASSVIRTCPFRGPISDSPHHGAQRPSAPPVCLPAGDRCPYGFSTCVKLDGVPEAVAHYITKYVTKDTKKILGNFYYAGGGISRKPEAEYANLDFDDIPAKPYFVPALGINFKYVTVQGGQA